MNLQIFALALLAVGALGTLTSTIFLAMSAVGARRFKRDQGSATRTSPAAPPAISVIKPIHGSEPLLRQNLEGFFRQDYPSFELIFAARQRDDEGLKVVDSLIQQYPHVQAQVLAVGEPPFPNAKVYSLNMAVRAAHHDILLMSDSDVSAGPDYLQAMARPFADPAVGLVTNLYRGHHSGGFWALLETLAMSVAMPAGAVTARMLEGMRFALGTSIAMRRQALDDIGGMQQFLDYSAEDFFLGNMVAHKNGWRVELSPYIIEHMVPRDSATAHWEHQVRWAKTTRYCRPQGHLGTGLIFAMPYGILALAGGLVSGHLALGLLLFTMAVAKGIIEALVIGWGVVRDAKAVKYCWLYPAEDIVGFAAWAMSYLGGSKIVWRGEVYQLMAQGRMAKIPMEQLSKDIAYY